MDAVQCTWICFLSSLLNDKQSLKSNQKQPTTWMKKDRAVGHLTAGDNSSGAVSLLDCECTKKQKTVAYYQSSKNVCGLVCTMKCVGAFSHRCLSDSESEFAPLIKGQYAILIPIHVFVKFSGFSDRRYDRGQGLRLVRPSPIPTGIAPNSGPPISAG